MFVTEIFWRQPLAQWECWESCELDIRLLELAILRMNLSIFFLKRDTRKYCCSCCMFARILIFQVPIIYIPVSLNGIPGFQGNYHVSDSKLYFISWCFLLCLNPELAATEKNPLLRVQILYIIYWTLWNK